MDLKLFKEVVQAFLFYLLAVFSPLSIVVLKVNLSLHFSRQKPFYRKLHIHWVYNSFSLPNVVSVMKPGRVRWVKHVAFVGEMRKEYKIVVGKPQGTSACGWGGC
jgi:hypothetical protein